MGTKKQVKTEEESSQTDLCVNEYGGMGVYVALSHAHYRCGI